MYFGDVCQEALHRLQSCRPGKQGSGVHVVYIPANRKQDELELQAHQFVYMDLPTLQPTQECEEEIVTLFCFHMFKLCDSNGTFHQPLSGQCQNIRNDTCALEWQRAETSGNITLLDCESLPDRDDSSLDCQDG